MKAIFEKPLGTSLFCLHNSSTAPFMKITRSARGELLLVNRKKVVAPILAKGQREFLRWVLLVAHGESVVVDQSKELLFPTHFSTLVF